MQGQTYTHRDLAKLLGVSETTIKSYRSKFPTFLPVARQGKPVRLHQEALSVCLRIRELFAQGLSILQTADRLRAEFKEYPSHRRLSIARRGTRPSSSEALTNAEDSALARRMEEMAQAQRQAKERMEQLEAEVRNLATLEAASKALVAELVAELRAARSSPANAVTPSGPPPPPDGAPGAMAQWPGQAAPDHTTEARSAAAPPPEGQRAAGPTAESMEQPSSDRGAAPGETVLTARKIVTVHGQDGPVASYALGREPKPEPLFPEPGQPKSSFLNLPVVIRSDRGDFLGLPGGQSVRRLVDMLSPEGSAAVTWFQEGEEVWTCAIPLGRAQKREMVFERTTTPRGNLVALIRRMSAGEAEATPEQIQEIFRQLRDQLS
jgi:hypothetical protein